MGYSIISMQSLVDDYLPGPVDPPPTHMGLKVRLPLLPPPLLLPGGY